MQHVHNHTGQTLRRIRQGFMLVLGIALVSAAAPSWAQGQTRTFNSVIEELKGKFAGHAREYGIHKNLLERPPKNDQKKRTVIQDRLSDLSDGYGDLQIALVVYDAFKQAKFDVQVVQGPEALGFSSRHTYNRVDLDGDWVLVDFSPPYYRHFPFIDNPVPHPDSDDLFVFVESDLAQVKQINRVPLQADAIYNYRALHRKDASYLIKVGTCADAPFDGAAMAPYRTTVQIAFQQAKRQLAQAGADVSDQTALAQIARASLDALQLSYLFCAKVYRVAFDKGSLQQRQLIFSTKAIVPLKDFIYTRTEINQLRIRETAEEVWKRLSFPVESEYEEGYEGTEYKAMYQEAIRGMRRYAYYVLLNADFLLTGR